MIKRVTFTAPPPMKAKTPRKPTKKQRREAIAAKRRAAASVPKGGNEHTPDAKLAFTPLVQRACDLTVELRRLEAGGGKLSASAFLKEAVTLCGKDEKALAELQARIDQSPVAPSIMVFIRKCSRAMASPNFPSIPTKKLEKLIWQFGSEDTLAALNIANVGLGDAIGLAVVAAVQRWPENFGSVTNAEQHRARVEELHLRLAKIYSLMKQCYTAADTLVESRSLSPTDRDKGLVCVRLNKFPAIHLGLPDWPKLMVAAELHASGGAPQKEAEPEPATGGPMDPAAKRALLDQVRTVREISIPMASATM